MSSTERNVLPARRTAETFEIIHGNQRNLFVVTLGRYPGPNGAIGEVFVTGPKAGSEMDAIARDGAILLSLALQHHVPLATIRHALTRDARGNAETVIGKIVDRIS